MMNDDELRLQRAQERLDRLRATQAPSRPPAPKAPVAESVRALRAVPVMTEAESAALRARQERYHAQLLEQERALALRPESEDRWLASCGVGLRHRGLELQADLVPAELRSWGRDAKQGASAILCGPTGSGKTAAAVWAMRTLYRAGRAEVSGWRCASAAFVSCSELFGRVFEKQPLTHFERVDLLVIDDWGMAYETDWPLAAIDRLIDRRWSDLRSTIITANMTPDVLEQRYPRVCSRLCDSSGPGVVVVNRGDLRRAPR